MWFAIFGGNLIFIYATLYWKETITGKIYRRGTSIEQIPDFFFTQFISFHVSIAWQFKAVLLKEPTMLSCA